MPGSPSATPKAKLALRFMPFLLALPLLEPLCPVSPLPLPDPPAALFAWLPAEERGAERCASGKPPAALGWPSGAPSKDCACEAATCPGRAPVQHSG